MVILIDMTVEMAVQQKRFVVVYTKF